MDTRNIGIGVLVIGSVALGGAYMLMNDGDTGAVDPAVTEMYAKAQAQDFGVSSFDPLEYEETEQRAPEAQEQNNRSAGGFSRGDFAARMAQFDLDGDGILSEGERDEMRQAMRAEMLARFDLDGDGELSREERQAARMARFENSDRGQDLMRQFDLDGDGVLNDEEQAAMDAHVEELRDARRDEQIARFDLDGDGQVSGEERQAGREEFMQNMTEEYDLDGDGQLSIEEQQQAFEAMRQQREIDRFVSQFDTDQDGVMGASDYEAFAELYGNGDLAADVNHDGVVNLEDLMLYRDLVTQSGE